jgi:homoserine kinase type II
MRVFVLQHTHEFADGTADTKLIGVYASEQSAQEAMAALRGRPGFSEQPAGFQLDAYELDATHWREGFASTGDYQF